MFGLFYKRFYQFWYLLQATCRYTFLRSLKDAYCMFRTCNECEALWVITSHATAPSVTMGHFLRLLDQNHPALDTYWTTRSEELRAEASALYNSTRTKEQRRSAFRFKDCIVLSVYMSVFAYSSRLCKPVEFLELSNPAFHRAQTEGKSLCQVLNAHMSQQFLGRYLLFEATEYIQNCYLSGWFRAAGCCKTDFSIGPGNVIRLGNCLHKGKTCADRARYKAMHPWWMLPFFPACLNKLLKKWVQVHRRSKQTESVCLVFLHELYTCIYMYILLCVFVWTNRRLHIHKRPNHSE